MTERSLGQDASNFRMPLSFLHSSNRSRFVVIGLLALGAIAVTYYFHGILHTGRAFSHLFYIPIILAALWWEEKGLLVAVFFCGLLLLSGLLLRPAPVSFNDFFRAVMFLAVALIVAHLRSRISAAETALKARTMALSDKTRKLQCLYSMTQIREEPGIDMDGILQKTATLIEETWQFSERVYIRISLGQREYRTADVPPASCEQQFCILVHGKPNGFLAAGPLGNPAPRDWASLAQAEADLMTEVARRIGRLIEHENARKALVDHKNSLEIQVEQRTAALRQSNERLKQEIAERVDAERALADSEKNYRHLVENANDAICIVQKGRIAFSNQRTVQLFESSTQDLAGFPLSDLTHASDREHVSDIYARRMKGEDVPITYSARMLTRCHNALWAQISAARTLWYGSPASLLIIRDIGSQLQIEAELRQAHTMEAVATLAGGIAHQFNNALSGIIGNIDLLLLERPGDLVIKKYTDVMAVAAQSMARWTDQLLGYARGGKYCPEIVCLSEFTAATLPLILSEADDGIEVVTDLMDGLPKIQADTVQLQMVLLDVVRNALEAVQPPARIAIRTESVRITQERAVKGADSAPGRYAVISVEDSGIGMDAETVKRIFEPFFTTRFQGRGLGMAAAYGIMHNHHGWIDVDSSPGRGTSVSLYFPTIDMPLPISETLAVFDLV